MPLGSMALNIPQIDFCEKCIIFLYIFLLVFEKDSII